MPTSPATTSHAYWLDWGRFLAAFVVAITHTRNLVWLEWGGLEPASRHVGTFVLFAVGRMGREAVIFFFVLSGYFVGGACLRACLTARFDPRRYAVERITRIYPPYLGAIVLTLIVEAVLNPASGLQVGTAFGQLVFLQGAFVPTLKGNSPLWSLAYEAWFYLLGGAIATFIAAPRGPTRWLALLGAAFAAVCIWRGESIYLASWIFGACAFVWRDHLATRLPLYAGCLLAAAGIASLQSAWVSAGFPTNPPNWMPGKFWATGLLAVGICLTIPGVARLKPGRPAALGFEKLGQLLAASSFSLYLVHQPLLDLVAPLLPARSAHMDLISLVLFFSLLVALCASAWLFASVFEALTPKLRKRWRPLTS